MKKNQKAVIFVDILGFKSLVGKHPLDIKSMLTHEKYYSIELDEILRYLNNPLTKVFTQFHSLLKHKVDLAQKKHALTSISFSDSAFISTNYLFEAVAIASSLMQSLLSHEIPARMGIGYGTFATLRFRSDITPDGGDHSSHFLGSAVIAANKAESCGIKGMRILLDPSTSNLLTSPIHNPKGKNYFKYLKCNSAGSKYLDDHLNEVNYWPIGNKEEKECWRGFQDMWSSSPKKESIHYKETASAIDSMRVQLGKPKMINLNRRTLPKEKIRK
ncbi:hypothetical protein EHQ46_16115 [Leptospira yanagawae]|uniref:Guanylate cyclase domain-containing protein n=1 Tax=Leptospira yanagawae TaxID=293069 RepID=A0ABY2LXU8_9LEPT|nr:hypothetical protein [Leptospira yanagawae]TGL17712.1 hypothetical protein EHQ46_16115 [Leptospira yanagawae]